MLESSTKFANRFIGSKTLQPKNFDDSNYHFPRNNVFAAVNLGFLRRIKWGILEQDQDGPSRDFIKKVNIILIIFMFCVFFYVYRCCYLPRSCYCLSNGSNHECVPCFVKKMDGKVRHCFFFRANLHANICAELGYDFYSANYANKVDVVSFKSQKPFGLAGVKANVGGLLSVLCFTP